MNNTPTPEQVDAIIAEWGLPIEELSEIDKLREHGKILVAANKRHFNDAQAAHKENVRLQAIVNDLKGKMDALGSDLSATRRSHAELCRGIKAVLGYDRWPRIPGDFVQGILGMLQEHVAGIKEALAEFKNHNNDLREELADCRSAARRRHD